MVNITKLFKKCGFNIGSVKIKETSGMYPYKNNVENNWAYFSAKGLKRFKEILEQNKKTFSSAGIVGIGSGVEGMVATEIFKKQLKKLIITDIDNEILDGAVENIKNYIKIYCKNTKTKLVPLVGSFCEPIRRAKQKVDFIYGNIPNLPATGKEDLERGAEKGTFVPASLYNKYKPAKEFIAWALAAQYAYLVGAKKILNNGGAVITELGGRVPIKIINKLFNKCGFKMEEIIVGFKEQTEALIDFVGYSRLEKKYGVQFEFYKCKESIALLKKLKIKNPTHKITGDEIKKLLLPYKISASEALLLYKKGIKIGHTVHLFKGIKKI